MVPFRCCYKIKETLKKSPGSDYNFKFNSRLTLLLRSAARPLLCSVPLLLFSASLPLCLHVRERFHSSATPLKNFD